MKGLSAVLITVILAAAVGGGAVAYTVLNGEPLSPVPPPSTLGVWWTGTPDFVINETSHFDAGTKVNTTTTTNRYNNTVNALEMDFPYANNTNVIAYWRFEGNLNNEAGQPLTQPDATKMGVYNTTNGVFGSAFTFDGANDFLNLTDNNSYDMTDGSGHDIAFTFMFWARPHVWATGVTDFGMMEKGNDFASPSGWDSYLYNGRNRLYVIKSDASAYEGKYSGTANMAQGAVNLHAFVYDGRGGTTASAGITYYKNATSVSMTADDGGTYANMSGNSYPLLVGGDLVNGIYMDGEFDEVMIIRGSTDGVGLTQTEVTRRFNNGKQYIDTSWGGYTANASWTSATQTMTGDYLANMTINLTFADKYSNITKVEWLNATDNLVMATNTTDVTTSGLTAFVNTSSTNLQNVSENFKVKIYFDGNGTCTAIVDDIIGYYYTEPTPPQITIQFPANTTYCSGGNFAFNITTNSPGHAGEWCGHSRNGGANQTMTNSTGNWWGAGVSLAGGTYNSVFCCNNTMGDMNCTDVNYTILNQPTITIKSPANTTYCADRLWFNMTLDYDYDSITTCTYSLDNLANTSLTNSTGNWNHYRTMAFNYCNHNVTFYCNRTCTETEFSEDNPVYTSTIRRFWSGCGTGAAGEAAIAISLIMIAGTLIYIFIGFNNAYTQDMLTVGTKLLFIGVGFTLIIGTIFVMAEMATSSGATGIGDMLEEYYITFIVLNSLFIMLYVLYLFRFIFSKVFWVSK